MQLDSGKILKIAKRWKISRQPEYRAFRCALCQLPMRKAWHVWLNKGRFRLEVHFCRKCIGKVQL